MSDWLNRYMGRGSARQFQVPSLRFKVRGSAPSASPRETENYQTNPFLFLCPSCLCGSTRRICETNPTRNLKPETRNSKPSWKITKRSHCSSEKSVFNPCFICSYRYLRQNCQTNPCHRRASSTFRIQGFGNCETNPPPSRPGSEMRLRVDFYTQSRRRREIVPSFFAKRTHSGFLGSFVLCGHLEFTKRTHAPGRRFQVPSLRFKVVPNEPNASW
jgi:hypothetical protein